MIEGLQIEREFENGKVYYEPVVLTVSGVSKFRDDEISFREIQGFWSIRFLATHEFNKGKQEDNSQTSPALIFPTANHLSSECSHKASQPRNQAGRGLATQARQIVRHSWTSGT